MHAVTKRNTIGVMAELERRACPLDNQGNDSEARVAPGRQGASALACRGAACSSRAQVSNRAGTQSGIHI